MRTSISVAISFTVGAISGCMVTYYLLKKHFKEIADTEIESVKKAFEGYNPDYSDENTISESSECKKERYESDGDYPDKTVMEYLNTVKKAGYAGKTDYTSFYLRTEDDTSEMTKEPYVISPDDFDEIGYDVVSLTYYSDGVLANTDGDVVDDVDELIGNDSLSHFGEYEEDSVFVRNDLLKTDFEILKDPCSYCEAYGNV